MSSCAHTPVEAMVIVSCAHRQSKMGASVCRVSVDPASKYCDPKILWKKGHVEKIGDEKLFFQNKQISDDYVLIRSNFGPHFVLVYSA